MPLVCPRCSRINPPEALYCYHDGAALDAGHSATPLAVGSQPFPAPFVFTSGRSCRNFDELVLACEDEWDAAREVLAQGFLAGYLNGLGRADLARAAERAANEADGDRALSELLARLPGTSRHPPHLIVRPTELTLGQIAPDEDRRLVFQLENQGGGVLYGSVVSKDDWLRIGDAPGLTRKGIQFRHDFELSVQIVGRVLRAGDKPLTGRLVVRTNGGEQTITVRADVPVQPFADGLFAGARTPRELAHKAKAAPKAAAPLFENGGVRKWYEANGWIYPVQGPAATGLAAVQQFFEALGLVHPPRVQVAPETVRLIGWPGQEIEATLTVRALERSPVHAHGTASEEWVVVGPAQLHGQTAQVPIRVPKTPDRPDETLRALVWLSANGGQRFTVDVELVVTRTPLPTPLEAPAAIPFVVVSAGEPPALRKHAPLRMYRLPVAVLLCLLLLPCAHDSLWIAFVDKFGSVCVGAPHADAPRIAVHFHEEEQPVSLGEDGMRANASSPRPYQAVWLPSMRFGISVIADEQGRQLVFGKRLTFDKQGRSNNTVIALDDSEWLFGEQGHRLPDGTIVDQFPGHSRMLDQHLDNDRGRRSEWVYENAAIRVTQLVEVVEGSQSGVLDTVVVRYFVENEGHNVHRVGLRFLLDTYIGTNDGVPFLIPGQEQLCTTSAECNEPHTLPDFIQAREHQDLTKPGTVAQLELKLPGVEPPSRMTLGAWPSAAFADGLCKQERTLWQVPVHSMQQAKPADSAVVLYWEPRKLWPGDKGRFGFAYGLGQVHGDEGRGKLATTAGGSFAPLGEFTVAAYVSHPTRGQTVTLLLPAEFALVAGDMRQAVHAPAGGLSVSPVTWKVRGAAVPGNYRLRVRSNDGVAQSQSITIRPSTN